LQKSKLPSFTERNLFHLKSSTKVKNRVNYPGFVQPISQSRRMEHHPPFFPTQFLVGKSPVSG
jgi:hypothetical protein